jgi:hypothetical protein
VPLSRHQKPRNFNGSNEQKSDGFSGHVSEQQEVHDMGLLAALTAILNESGFGWFIVVFIAVVIIFGLYVGFR